MRAYAIALLLIACTPDVLYLPNEVTSVALDSIPVAVDLAPVPVTAVDLAAPADLAVPADLAPVQTCARCVGASPACGGPCGNGGVVCGPYEQCYNNVNCLPLCW